MLDLIMLGWPFFAGAGAIGALTGYLTSARDKTTAVAPGWVFLALLLTVGAGAGASLADVFQGRTAVTFDIALIAGAAYVLALPIGRALKLMGASEKEAPRVIAPPRPVVAKPVAEREPIVIDAVNAAPPVVAQEEPAPALEEIALAAKALSDKAVVMRATDKAAKKSVGQRPPTLAAPQGAADDLTRIKGLGPKSAEKLNALGVFHYDQIAGWSRDNAKWVGAEIGVASRVERDNWVAQARALAGKSEDKRAASAA